MTANCNAIDAETAVAASVVLEPCSKDGLDSVPIDARILAPFRAYAF